MRFPSFSPNDGDLMSGPRVYDGRLWTVVAAVAEDDNESGPRPVRPVDDGDGTIFVSIASYRGTDESGTT
jgi:hypothetical protein